MATTSESGVVTHTHPNSASLVSIRSVAKHFGKNIVLRDISLEIAEGEFLTILGESGSGKTTLLRILAGFEQPTAGEVWMQGERLDTEPPYRRLVNTVFQNYALFPHMTVEQNVGYGLRRMDLERAEKQQRVQQALEMVQLGAHGNRKPHQLSGGQRQRVALARALIRRPKVLLLDEPLSALDKKLRERTQFELMDLQYQVGTTFIVVTHDQDEAMALASRIAVMDRGRVVQVGTPSEIYEFPQSRFVADFVGTTNLFEGDVAECQPGMITVNCPETGCALWVDDVGRFSTGQRVWVALRPEKIRLTKQPVSGERVNQLRGTVWELGYLGNRSTYQIKTASGKLITVFAQNERRTSEWSIDWSDEVYVSWDASAALLLHS